MAETNGNGHKFVTPSDLSVPATPITPFDGDLTHTPQNSCVTLDSIAATCDSVISPRNRRKGVKINININGSANRLNISHSNGPSIGSNNTALSQVTSSAGDSPPSPLSEARTMNDVIDNFQFPSTKSRTNTHTNTNTNTNTDTNSHKSQFLSHLYHNNNNNGKESDIIHNHNHKILELIDKYKEKLQKLNGLLSPMQLFHDIDLMIRNYQKLRKEYCLQWELQQLYRQQIRSLLKQS